MLCRNKPTAIKEMNKEIRAQIKVLLIAATNAKTIETKDEAIKQIAHLEQKDEYFQRYNSMGYCAHLATDEEFAKLKILADIFEKDETSSWHEEQLFNYANNLSRKYPRK